MQNRTRTQTPAWVNDQAVNRGYLTLNGKQYPIVKQQYPADEQAERNTLGCLLAAGEIGNANQAMTRIGFVHYDDFFYYRNGMIFRAMERIYQRGDAIDVNTVLAELTIVKHGDKTALDLVGGQPYLYELANIAAVNLETYARQVVRMALRRASKVSAEAWAKLADNEQLELEELMAQAQALVQDIAVRAYNLTNQDTFNLYDSLDAHMDAIAAEVERDDFEPGIPIRFVPGLNEALLGWRNKKLYIIAAPPGWAKTALVLCAALDALRQGKRVLFISLEMPIDDMLERLICIHGGINYLNLQKRKLTADERKRLAATKTALQGYKASKAFIMTQLRHPTMAQIRAKIAEHQLDPGFDVVFVDYAANNTVNGEDYGDDGNKHAQAIYTGLTNICKDFQIPLIVTTQMNQKWDSRKGKRPGETDLYYGSIARFAADVIGFIYHPAKAKSSGDDSLTDERNVEFILRKNRSGPVGDDVTIEMTWEPEYVRFTAGDDNDDRNRRY